MGITIKSKNRSADMGYSGFMKFREKVAELTNKEFGEHYSILPTGSWLFGNDRKNFFESYDNETLRFCNEGLVSGEIVNFLHQCDCEGEIDQNQAQKIYEVIKDYTDDIVYGYGGRPDCAMFDDIKGIFKDCAENGESVEWD